MTSDANKQKEKTETGTVPLDNSRDSGEFLAEPQNKQEDIENTELASEEISNLSDTRVDKISSEPTKKRLNLDHGDLDDEALGIKNTLLQTNRSDVLSQLERQKSVFFPVLFGSLSGGFIGFAAAYLLLIFSAIDKSPTITEVETSLKSQISENSNQIARIETTLEDQVLTVEKLQNSLDRLYQRVQANSVTFESNSSLIYDIQGLNLRVESVENFVANFADRFSTVEKRLGAAALSQEVIEAYNKEVVDLIATMTVEREKVRRILNNANFQKEKAAKIEQKTKARSALYDIRTLMEAGKSFNASLEQLQKFPGVAIPKALWDTSFIGIISLEELADAFPEAARAAIAADRSGLAYDGTSESLLGFLKSQLRARSVAPIEGADADAVLSRVEAALKNSHLDLAISELAKLDPPAADLMANWKASALQRIEIIKALDGIAAKVEE